MASVEGDAPAAADSAGGERARWTDAMVAQLVHLRLVELRAQFQAARRHPQLLAVAWAALRLRLREWLQRRGGPPLNVVQLKNKWFGLRKEFHDVRAQEAAVRQARRDGQRAAPVAYPSYWRVLVGSFGDDDDALSPTARAVEELAAAEAAARPSRKGRRTERPASEAEEETVKAPRMKWTQPMVAVLLELRLVTLRDVFRGSRSSARLRSAWLKLREQFAAQSGVSTPDVLQLKNKFGTLKKEFVAITRAQRAFAKQQQQQSRDGESSLTPPEVPTYWPVLEKYFTGRVEVPEEDESGLTGEEDDSQETEEVPPADGFHPPRPPTAPTAATGADVSSFPRVGRMKWNDGTTKTLLDLRAREMKDAFSGERGPTQLKAHWETLRIRFARAHNMLVDVNQLKNKYNALRREYTAIYEQRQQAAKNASGEQRVIELPPYWDTLELAFGSLASSDANGEPESGSVAAHSSRTPSSRKRRWLSRLSADDEISGVVDGERDPMQRLEELFKLQAERQEDMRALLKRQAEGFDAMVKQTAVVNSAVLELIRKANSRSSSLVDNGTDGESTV